MDVQTGLVYVAVVVISALVIGFVSVFAMKEKSYEEAIAEQRKLPDDLLLGKKETKAKEKKHKNKTGKKVKEKKEDKEEKEDKPEHVQFEETPQILPPEPPVQENGRGSKKKGKVERVKPILINKEEPVAVIAEPTPSSQTAIAQERNHFDVIQPKDDLELIRSHSRENINLISQSESTVSKSPKETPTKVKKNKESSSSRTKKDDQAPKEADKKEVPAAAVTPVAVQPKEVKEAVASAGQSVPKESKKIKKKNDFLAQIGGDRDGVNFSLLKPLVQKAELSRSEIQFLIDQLLNKQQDNPLETTEWTESRADPVIKLKKQLADKEKALKDEQEASVSVQNKLLELRAELNGERSRLTASVRQLEDALNAKVSEAQTLHTRMQHILESHAAEKQGFSRQIEQLQSKINEDQAIIVKMQEDQGQTHGQMQQELLAQRKQLEAQFAQMREAENALKSQLAQKHIEITELQSVNVSMQQELQATCESSTHEIEMLRQENSILQEQIMHSDNQLQHFKEAGDRLQELHRQLEESRRAHGELEHRMSKMHRHEQDLQKQLTWLQGELDTAKATASTATALREQLEKALAQVAKLKSDQIDSSNEDNNASSEDPSILQSQLKAKEQELQKALVELNNVQLELRKSQAEIKKLEAELTDARNDLKSTKSELSRALDNYKLSQNDLKKCQDELREIQNVLAQTRAEFSKINSSISTVKDNKSAELELQIVKLQEENQRVTSQLGNVTELQKELRQLREKNEHLTSQLAAVSERPTVEGRENGIEEKAQKNSIQTVEATKFLAQKDELSALKTALSQKEKELGLLANQVDSLRSDFNSQRNVTAKLQDDLQQQRSKNDDLRRKNWKVMEALNSAESRVKNKVGVDEDVQKLKVQEQEATKALLQRIFPEIKVSEKSHDQWMKVFEQQVQTTLSNSKTSNKNEEADLELEKTNKSLQAMVNHYKQIIYDTEGMLNKLQSHIESEEKRWQAQLLQKENEVTNLRVEISELQSTTTSNSEINAHLYQSKDTTLFSKDGVEFAFNCIEKSLPTITNELQQKIAELERRLTEAESSKSEKQNFQIPSSQTRVQENRKEDLFLTVEQLKEEKARLYQQLQNESSERALVDAEVAKLRSLVEQSESELALEQQKVSQLEQEISEIKEICGGSSPDLSTLNGPPISDSPKSEPSHEAQCLIAALEKPFLKNQTKTELDNCSSTEPDINHESSLTSTRASNSCLLTENHTENSCASLNGQQHSKKHKKKRKGGSGRK